MNIVFLGTPKFAVPSLEILISNGYNIKAVVTTTDKIGGRSRKQLLESAVKKAAASYGIPILQPPNLKNPHFIEQLASFKADLQVIVAFRMLPEAVWNMPPHGTMNLHASLLPKYRGAAPINWAIMNGEQKTGLSTFFLRHEIDTGNILMQKEIPININDTAGTIHDVMMSEGADLVLCSVQAIQAGNILLTPQDETLACSAPKLNSENSQIDWNKTPLEVHNHIRGLSPYPGAWTKINELRFKILGSHISDIPETLLNLHEMKWKIQNDRIFRRCRNGFIEITELQAPGKKRMSSSDFVKGNAHLLL